MRIRARQIAITAILLAICILSQVFKNLSVYITGPVVNACIVLCALFAGPLCAVILSVITPITAFFISGSPVMAAVPQMIVFIMGGNVIIALLSHFIFKPTITKRKRLVSPLSAAMAVLCAAAKGLFMGLTISLWLLPTFIPAESPMYEKLPVFQTTFSITQFVTALIGFVYVFILIKPLSKIADIQGEDDGAGKNT